MVSEMQPPRDSRRYKQGLNPCFSGRWSRREEIPLLPTKEGRVLILVLVEDGLGGTVTRTITLPSVTVLILVLVEDGLGDGTLCRWNVLSRS